MRALLPALLLASACAAFAAPGCKEYGVPAGTGPHHELNFLDMGDQPKIKAQRGDLIGGPEFNPAEGSIPRGFTPYLFAGNPDLAGVRMANPLTGDPKVLERGKLMYGRFCVPCHGQLGDGDGLVPKKGFPTPPSLHTVKVRGWSDGRIYAVISEGQNIMPSYAAQVRQEDRWAIIRHVRQLQAGQPVIPDPPAAPTASSSAAPSGSNPPPSLSGSAPAPATSASAPAVPSTSAAPERR